MPSKEISECGRHVSITERGFIESTEQRKKKNLSNHADRQTQMHMTHRHKRKKKAQGRGSRRERERYGGVQLTRPEGEQKAEIKRRFAKSGLWGGSSKALLPWHSLLHLHLLHLHLLLLLHLLL